MMLAEFERSGSFHLLHDPGLGKSCSTLGSFGIMHQRGEASTMLVVCPSSVMGAWTKDAARMENIIVLPLVHGSARSEAMLQRALLEHANTEGMLVVCINYEKTFRMEHVLRAAKFDVIVCDESQRIKAPGSKQSRAMHRIGKSAKYRAILTGTPTPESELDFFGQLRFTDDALLGTNHTNFLARFAKTMQLTTKTGQQYPKISVNKAALPELEQIVYSRAHRADKETCLDLPEQIDVHLPFDLEPKARKVYDQLREESIALLDAPNGEVHEVLGDLVITRLLRLSQIAGGWVRNETTESLVRISDAKMKMLKDRLELHLERGEKVVVFYRFTREGEEIREIAARMVGTAKKPIEQPMIGGDIPASERGEMVRRFMEDDDARVFVAQIASAGLGITLTSACTTIYYSLGFSGADHEQSRARTHRIGQERVTRYEYLVARDTVDEHVLDALNEKRNIAEEMGAGGWRRYLGCGP